MSAELQLAPKTKRPPGEPCCVPVVHPDVDRERAERMAVVAKALGDPVRMQLVDVLRKAAGEVCDIDRRLRSSWRSSTHEDAAAALRGLGARALGGAGHRTAPGSCARPWRGTPPWRTWCVRG